MGGLENFREYTWNISGYIPNFEKAVEGKGGYLDF